MHAFLFCCLDLLPFLRFIALQREKSGAGASTKPSLVTHPCVTMFASDVVNFTRISSQSDPDVIIGLMSGIFDIFDTVCAEESVVCYFSLRDSLLMIMVATLRRKLLAFCRSPTRTM